MTMNNNDLARELVALASKLAERDEDAYQDAANELREAADQIDAALQEAEGVLNRLGPEGQQLRRRAESYWLAGIKNFVHRAGHTHVTMEDTINEIDQL